MGGAGGDVTNGSPTGRGVDELGRPGRQRLRDVACTVGAGRPGSNPGGGLERRRPAPARPRAAQVAGAGTTAVGPSASAAGSHHRALHDRALHHRALHHRRVEELGDEIGGAAAPAAPPATRAAVATTATTAATAATTTKEFPTTTCRSRRAPGLSDGAS